MKDYVLELARAAPDPVQGRNRVREYLQARLLGALQGAQAFLTLAFHGGTALQFLYATGRYSEALDFALERSPERYDFRAYLKAVQTALTPEGYALDIKLNDRKAVHSAFVRFPELLYTAGLSPHKTAVLAVKVEVDTRPPAGAGLTTTLVRRHILLNLQHHDPASLLAGKLHALLQRPYLKGRDLYDLVWYLSAPDWPAPNLTLLNNALRQSGWTEAPLTLTTWRAAVRRRLENADWRAAAADVRPFLERPSELALLTPENLGALLR